MKTLILTLALLGTAQMTQAHEGHATPGVIKSIHGGTALGGKEINLEYMHSGTELKLFPVSHEGQDLDISKVKITATATPPKGKPTALNLEYKGNAFVSNVDFKNAYRLEIQVSTESSGKKDKFKFQIEK